MQNARENMQDSVNGSKLTVDIMHIVMRWSTKSFSLTQYFSQGCKKKVTDQYKTTFSA